LGRFNWFYDWKKGIEKAFNRKLSNKYNIHRTRRNFPNDGIDSFENMAEKGLIVTDRVVREEIGGTIDLEKNIWIIPLKDSK